MAVKKYTGTKFNITLTYVKPALSGLVMGAIVVICYRLLFGFLGNAISTILSIAVGAIVYVVMVLMTKAITDEEIKMLPKGKKLAKIINRFKSR